ncbi:hypothetical protein SAMN06295885_1237 [Rathayibacter oskolensis]|uniref:AB hydrolase-1 domain-containing protein n=1 Tax=Rathayibacter oskolensis TaxID=1891671 RepID=A0A1X7NFC8_9MICO|nr:alpha/beta fold hydrolase [Rathayibacter oskolensis]SMH36418.1 hypothetical protein SAMN06295885_1237 [Rathayibacter oskolensis]
MTVDVVFLHGAGDGAHDEDAALVESLVAHLGDGFRVAYPRLPEDDAADERWLDAIGASLAGSEGPLAVVGHSAGGYLLLKHLATARVDRRILAIGILAAPFPGGDDDWTFDGFDLPDDLGDRLPSGARVLLYAAEDDEVVPFAHRDLYAAAIPQALTRTLTGGHRFGGDLGGVAEDLRALVSLSAPEE